MPRKGRSPHGHSLVETANRAKADWCPRCKKWFQPLKGENEPSGKFILRIPPMLHQKLIEQARSEGVSVNLLVNTMLAEHVGKLQERVRWTAGLLKTSRGER